MPNWCKQKVTIDGPKRKQLIDAITNDGKVDFNKAIPMPEELDNEPVSFNHEPNQELIDKYGADNWYDWCLNNWGVKWNASESEINDTYIEYQTPWGVPMEFWKRMSKKYPTEEIVINYADEFEGNGNGEVIFKNGEIISDRDLSNNEKHWNWVWGWEM